MGGFVSFYILIRRKRPSFRPFWSPKSFPLLQPSIYQEVYSFVNVLAIVTRINILAIFI